MRRPRAPPQKRYGETSRHSRTYLAEQGSAEGLTVPPILHPPYTGLLKAISYIFW